MRIRIGILGDPSGWSLLLEQEGIPHQRIHGDLTPDHYSAVVVNDAADDREIEMVRQYLRLGGGVLCSAKVYAEVRGTTSGRRAIEYLLAEDDSLFARTGIVDLRQRSRIAWNANELPSDIGGPTAFVGTYEGGNVVALPFDPSLAALDERAARKSFYSPESRLPFERVSAVDKHAARRLVAVALQHLHRVRGLWYAHLWYYPDDAASVFGFRIDTDRSSAGEVETLYEFLRERRVRGSWFVDVGGQQQFLWRFGQMQGQEVGLHCFEHRTFPDEPRNHRNILRARDAFRNLNIGAVGFAAPFGIWNRALGKVVADFRFLYTSEFAYDHDNLPSIPSLGRDRRGALQIPVHPISIGSLRRQGYDANAMQRYFLRVAEEKRARREPLFFYHHPKDGHLPVLEELFRASSGPGVVHLTMQEYAEWWVRRTTGGMELHVRDQALHAEAGTNRPTAWLHIVRPDGLEAFHPVESKLAAADLAWQVPPPSPSIPRDIERARRFNYRIPLTLAVDRLASLRRGA